MRDEIDGRLWTEHHEGFSELIHQLLESAWIALCELNRIQFDAPWRQQRGRC